MFGRKTKGKVTTRVGVSRKDSFTPVSEYVDRIMERNEKRSWGFDDSHADALRGQLKQLRHAGPRSPVSVGIWRGQYLAYNLYESIAWLTDELAALGVELQLSWERGSWGSGTIPLQFCVFRPGSEMLGPPMLKATGLAIDLAGATSTPSKTMPWPGLEVIDFFCLNPQMLKHLSVSLLGICSHMDSGSPMANLQLCQFRDFGIIANSSYVEGAFPLVRYREL